MAVEVTIPSPGESISEVVLGPWQRSDGDWVDKDDILVEIESDKVTLEVPSPESGILSVQASEGDELSVGATIASIDDSAEKPAGAEAQTSTSQEQQAAGQKPGSSAPATATATPNGSSSDVSDGVRATPVARKLAEERGINLADVEGTGPSGRVTKSDVLSSSEEAKRNGASAVAPQGAGGKTPLTMASEGVGSRGVRVEKMSKLRQRIAERLVNAQHTAAMLTTFNEVDMTAVMQLRSAHKEQFQEKHGVGLGFMSFFAKACCSALQAYPRVNAYIVDTNIEFHDYVDISVAVGTDKGLVVPVVRNVETMSFAQVEGTIRDFAMRARDGKLSIDEMTGGTFTISNGGVYGSLNSTPILNPPQSGILGMHKIMKRPVEDPSNPGQIALRPMMYLALSYDHRIVDGAEAVGFLVHVKECLESPERMLIGI